MQCLQASFINPEGHGFPAANALLQSLAEFTWLWVKRLKNWILALRKGEAFVRQKH